ncbi:MAG TPA: hypothetical protein DDZ41_04285 [Flavobacterium sp.]|nr:hypothetical protein [Flavobacterium sp.]
MSSDESDNSKTNVVNSATKINIPYPPFWEEMPDVWFSQMENIFKVKRIKSDEQQYLHTVANLPVSIVASSVDIIQNLPNEGKYETLKNVIIKRKTLTDSQRLEKLLESTEIGDRSPSQFWRDLKSTAGNSALTNDELIKNLWLKRLPDNLRPIIMSRMTDEMSSLIELADKIWQLSAASRTSVCELKTEPNSILENLESEISELKAQIKSLHFQKYQNRNHRSRSRNRSQSFIANKPCYYHFKFGSKATKCKGGKCSFAIIKNIKAEN